MQNIREKLSLTVVGIVIAAIGVVAPIAWDWWNKRTQLTFEIRSTAAVISTAQPIEKLELTYDGKRISELTRVVLTLKNTGRTAITREDIVFPLTIASSAGELMEAQIISRYPANLDISALIQSNKAILQFSLLNPGEFADIDLLVTNRNPTLIPSGRIKNISELSVSDITKIISIRTDVGISMAIVGIFGLIFLTITGTLFLEVPKKRRSLSLIKSDNHEILAADSAAKARSFIYSDFEFLSSDNRRRADAAIDKLSWPLDEANRETLKNELTVAIKAEDSIGPGVISLVLALVAIFYVANHFLR